LHQVGEPRVVRVGKAIDRSRDTSGRQPVAGRLRGVVRRDSTQREDVCDGVGQRGDANQVFGACDNVEVDGRLAAPVGCLASHAVQLGAHAGEHVDDCVHVAARVEREQCGA
jgi:hypothetical protein